MKNLYKLIGIIAFVAVIGFSFAACDNGSGGGGGGGGGGTFTLTNIPSEYNGKYIQVFIHINGEWTGGQVWGSRDEDGFQYNNVRISNGRASIPLWTVDPDNYPFFKRYTSTETFNCSGYISVEDGIAAAYDDQRLNFRFPSVSFTNGSATKSWTDLIVW